MVVAVVGEEAKAETEADDGKRWFLRRATRGMARREKNARMRAKREARKSRRDRLEVDLR